MKTVTLTFTNKDAVERVITVRVDRASVAHVMMWYGAFFAGDDYTVTQDGQPVLMDHNGHPADIPAHIAALVKRGRA